MTYVLEMSTDPDILGEQVNAAYNPVTRYNWAAVHPGGLNIPAGADIVVIAHGNGDLIGNAGPAINITPAAFLVLIHSNMAGGAAPGRIFLSVCQHQIAQFAATVAMLAGQNHIWAHTQIFGHYDAVAGPVPPPGVLAWVQIFPH